MSDRIRRSSYLVGALCACCLVILVLYVARSGRWFGDGHRQATPVKDRRPAGNGLGTEDGLNDSGADQQRGTGKTGNPSSSSDSGRHREGSAAWFAEFVLFPLLDRLEYLDPDGSSGAGLAFLLDIIGRIPKTFQQRMEQAAAARLIPYSVRRRDDLAPQAVSALRDILGSPQAPAFSKMGALSALFGFKLDYNVRPIVSGHGSDLEFHNLFYDYPFASDEPDTYSFRNRAESDPALRGEIRRILEDKSPKDLLTPCCRALLIRPLAADYAVLLQAVELEEVDRQAKEAILDSWSTSGSEESADRLSARAFTAFQAGDMELYGIYAEALAKVGVAAPGILDRCRQAMNDGTDRHAYGAAVDLIVRIHARSNAAECSMILEEIIRNSGRSSGDRLLLIRAIVQRQDRNMLDVLRSAASSESDPAVRDALKAAIEKLADH